MSSGELLPGSGPVLVLGWGQSGRAAATFLAARGRPVVVADDGGLPKGDIPAGVTALAADERRDLLAGVEAVVVSPGVAASHPTLTSAVARGLPVISELELGFRGLEVPLLAVTGTNGKSTTVTLLARILEAAGLRTFAGGNLGTPLCEAAARAIDVAVAEVSSFQLEWVENFRPRVGVLLDVTPDHLDRHGDFDTYLKAKLRMFAGQRSDDAAVVTTRGGLAARVAQTSTASVSTFAVAPDPETATTVAGRAGREILGPDGFRVGLAPQWPVAPHDFQNAAAAVEAARRFGIQAEACEEALRAFEPLPHRLSLVATIDGVEWWNDSKATNVAAVCSGLTAFDQPVVLLAGGSSKNEDFSRLAQGASTIKLVIAYGAAAGEIEEGIGAGLPLLRAGKMEDAVQMAAERSSAGDVVLLAPACASFDEFRNYAHRSERFQELVGMLRRQAG